MKLLYIGTHFCPVDSMSRLLLLGDELVFLDRPSVMFDNWGTVGHKSLMRQVSFGEAPIKLTVLEPPSGPAQALYTPYVQADLENPAFIKAFLDGIRSDHVFAERVLPSNANYGEGRGGADIRKLLLSDSSLSDSSLDLSRGDPTLMYKPDTEEGRKLILRTLLVDVSVQVTSALIMADEVDALPVSDDGTYPKLLALRASSQKYVGGTPALAPLLGLHFARALIPDEMIQKIEFKGIFEYRNKTKDAYAAWNTELSKVAAKIGDTELANPAEAIQKIIASDLMPKVREYENEMASVRDKLFTDIVKDIATWNLPTLSIAYVTNMGYAGALATFASAVKATVPHIADFVTSRKATKRKHALSYLVGLTRR